jgi:hypothetical protein
MTLTLSSIQSISTYLLHLRIYTAQSPFSPLAPLVPLVPLVPLAPLASRCSLFTYLAPSSCDRNRPPPSQVNCKLTLFAPPFPPIVPPFPVSRNPNCSAPDNDDLGTNPLFYTEHLETQSFICL